MRVLMIFAIVAGMIQGAHGQSDDTEGKAPEALAFTVRSIDGEDIALSKYQGQVIVVVNVASKCGYTPQYAQLQSLYEAHREDGLVVLGFPCNQFRNQEPAGEAEIKQFCSTNYGVTFDLFAKIDVNGDQASDFYKHLTGLDLPPQGSGEIRWNFEKVIINRQGVPIARFKSAVRPDSKEFMDVIQGALAEGAGLKPN